MFFVCLGLVLIVMKLAAFGPVAAWSWLGVLWPFLGAIAWWTYADKSGLTKRREMKKMDDRVTERRAKHMKALGLEVRDRKR